jgi:hypothetical protein
MAERPSGVAVLGQEHVDPFITRGILLDVLSTKLAQGDSSALGEDLDGNPILADSYRITVEDHQDAMAFGNIKEITPGEVVIIRTGWSHLFGTNSATRARYIGEGGISPSQVSNDRQAPIGGLACARNTLRAARTSSDDVLQTRGAHAGRWYAPVTPQ